MNPFPGMNPYLEDPRFWRSFHNKFIALLETQLNAVLPKGYAANAEGRITIEPLEQVMIPDTVITRDSTYLPASGSRPASAAAQEMSERHGVLTMKREEYSEMYLEILTGDKWEQVVTVIELLSPTNKASGSRSHEEYKAKQRTLLDSSVNLVEIDLLREGRHTVTAPHYLLKRKGNWNYLVSVYRFWQHDDVEFWLNELPESLPKISIPLLQYIEEPQFDLQEMVNELYDTGPYPRRIDYSMPPFVRLSSQEQSAWMDALLREKGLRP